VDVVALGPRALHHRDDLVRGPTASCAIFMWMMSTGVLARLPTWIASSIARNTPSPSSRMWDE
jgi:hypothetical protein